MGGALLICLRIQEPKGQSSSDVWVWLPSAEVGRQLLEKCECPGCLGEYLLAYGIPCRNPNHMSPSAFPAKPPTLGA